MGAILGGGDWAPLSYFVYPQPVDLSWHVQEDCGPIACFVFGALRTREGREVFVCAVVFFVFGERLHVRPAASMPPAIGCFVSMVSSHTLTLSGWTVLQDGRSGLTNNTLESVKPIETR